MNHDEIKAEAKKLIKESPESTPLEIANKICGLRNLTCINYVTAVIRDWIEEDKNGISEG